MSTVRFPYECGIFAMPAFRDLLAYGRTFVEVEHYPSGGLLIRRGYVKVTGSTEAVRRFLRLLDRLTNPPSDRSPR